MATTTFPAAKLRSAQRIELAIQALSGGANVSRLAAENDVSRKYIYEQKTKARDALQEAFTSTGADDAVLFSLPVSKAWLQQVVLSLTLICHSSYRGVQEFLRDMLGISISLGGVHKLHQLAIQRARDINQAQDLSCIRVGLHDEIFHCNAPVLVGVDARSTYCYLLAAQEHRDAQTWAIHLLYLQASGFNPEYLIADQGTGLRAGQIMVWADKPCHGDVFHIVKQCEDLSNVLTSVAKGAATRCHDVDARMQATKEHGSGRSVSLQLGMVRQAATQSAQLAKDIKTLTGWLRQDVLELAGPALATRLELYDFVVAELLAREHLDRTRIGKVRVALQNQRNDLLAFAGVLQRKPTSSPLYWQGWCRLCSQMGNKCHVVFESVVQAMADTPRCSSMVENLNSRLRNYFTLRRQLGGEYLSLLQFFLNHRTFLRSRVAERVGKSPKQLMTASAHPHWLTMLGFGPLQPQRS